MKDQHNRNALGERIVTRKEVLDLVGKAFRDAGIHPWYVLVPGEEPGTHHVAVCMDSYAAAACLHGCRPGTTD